MDFERDLCRVSGAVGINLSMDDNAISRRSFSADQGEVLSQSPEMTKNNSH
jgi:hypothetical protein